MYQPQQLLYEGKAKKIFSVKDYKDLLWVEYKDSLTAFNAVKKGSFEDKGQINNFISNILYRHIENSGIQTHYIESPLNNILVCKKLEMIPLEVVVRNKAAGSLEKKFGLEHGKKLDKPLVEFFYKKDELADPFISDDQILVFKITDKKTITQLKQLALKVNSVLLALFSKANIELIDFKMEFGKGSDGQIILADEISPDSCRLWDLETGYVFDKDRFRKDLGQVKESYEEVLSRLRIATGENHV